MKDTILDIIKWGIDLYYNPTVRDVVGCAVFAVSVYLLLVLT